MKIFGALATASLAIISKPTQAEQYQDVELRCNGVYRDKSLTSIAPNGVSLSFELLLKKNDQNTDLTEIWLIGTISHLGWYFIDEGGYSTSYKYIMNSRNDMLDGWAENYKIDGLINSTVNLDRENGDITILSTNEDPMLNSTFSGNCSKATVKF